MAERVDAAAFDAAVLGAETPVLVDFYQDSCVPCKRLTPQLAKLEEAHRGELSVVKVNANFDPELASRLSVMATPTLVLFKDGEEVARSTGFLRLSELEDLVAPALG